MTLIYDRGAMAVECENLSMKRVGPRKASESKKRPDFQARLKRIYGSKKLRVSGALRIAEERGGAKD